MRETLFSLALLAGFVTLLPGCTPTSGDEVEIAMLDVSDVFGPEDQSDRLNDRFDDPKTRIFLTHAQNGHLDAMREMVDKGYDINTRGEANVTPLFGYVAYVRPVRRDVLSAMLDMGADVTAPLDNRMSLLNALARADNPEVLQSLLKAGVSPNTRIPATGSTFLMTVISEQNNALVRDLLAAGADAGLASDTGQTPFALARDSGNFEAVMLLIKAGADPRSDDKMLKHARLAHQQFGKSLTPDSANGRAHKSFGEWLAQQ